MDASLGVFAADEFAEMSDIVERYGVLRSWEVAQELVRRDVVVGDESIHRLPALLFALRRIADGVDL